MYKTSVRAMMRFSIKRLNNGDPSWFLRFASPDVELTFPGDNSWATMYRSVEKGRDAHPSHRGIEECAGFADRFVAKRVQFAVEDILVNGPPWNTRVALRAHTFIAVPGQADEYNNRAVAVLELKWGRLVRWEDYEDTERTAAWDELTSGRDGLSATTET